MSKKELEKIIKQNTGFFDSEEPSAAHFEKFLKKLDDIHQNTKKERFISILTHAASAAAVFLLVISIVLLRLQSSDDNLSQQLPAEVIEIKNYYQYQIESNLKTLNSNLEKCPAQKQNLQSCFKELDKSLMTIQSDLKENPGDERVLNALINNYQTKLDIMEQMVNITDKNCI